METFVEYHYSSLADSSLRIDESIEGYGDSKWLKRRLNEVKGSSVAIKYMLGRDMDSDEWCELKYVIDRHAIDNPELRIHIFTDGREIDYGTGLYSVPLGWDFFTSKESLDSLWEISSELTTKATSDIYPPPRFVYRMFDMLRPEDIRVLVIGQDPYHGPLQATGIAFAVNDGVNPPPSLKNIFEEVKNCAYTVSSPQYTNRLTKWISQGVFLLNTALTVKAGSPGSHSNLWLKSFTPNLMRYLDRECRDLIIVMWGRHAQSFSTYFGKRHLKIESPHPSPYSASTGFFGSKPFTKINEIFRQRGEKIIDWSL